eukprot:7966570-Alexandrium_andersonii.AAC.1
MLPVPTSMPVPVRMLLATSGSMSSERTLGVWASVTPSPVSRSGPCGVTSDTGAILLPSCGADPAARRACEMRLPMDAA